MKDINQEIEKLIMIKAEVDEINALKSTDLKVEIVSQGMYNFLSEKGLLKKDVFYRITSLELKPYIEDFRG